MKFIVDRKTWYRGKGPDNSRLRNNEGMMCCLGHISLQCGFTQGEINYVTSPGKLTERLYHKPIPEEYRWLADDGCNSDLSSDMMRINDDKEISDSVRELELKLIVQKAGHELEFIN